MKKIDDLKFKMIILLISFLLIGVVILMYFLDNSLGWGLEKILSCIIVNLWLFFLIPSLRYSFLLNRDKTAAEWFKKGMEFGSSGIALSILIAPYFGVKYNISR